MNASSAYPETAGSTSSGLLRRAQSHDQEAWRQLTSLYGAVVYQWARGARLQQSDAADVTQEVFRAVAAHIGEFRREDPSHSFRGWLWTITRNRVRDHYRDLAARTEATGGSGARQRIEQISDVPPDTPHPSGDASATYFRNQAAQLIRAEFEDRTWQAFWRVAIQRDKPADVAEDLGMSVGAVYMAKSRVLRRLRRELEELE